MSKSKKTTGVLNPETVAALEALLSTALADHSIQNLVAWKSAVDKVAKDQKAKEAYLVTLSKDNQKLFWSIPAKAAVVEEIISDLSPVETTNAQILTLSTGLGWKYFGIGQKCFAVKAEVGFGSFMNLCDYLGWNTTTVNRSMRVYRKWKDVRSVEKRLTGMVLRDAEAGPEKKPKVLSMFEQCEQEARRLLARKISIALRKIEVAEIAQEDEAAVWELMKKLGDEKLLRIASSIIYKRTLADKGIDPNKGQSEDTAAETAPNTVNETEDKL